MSGRTPPTDAEVEALRNRLEREATESGYHLNPDRELTGDLARGLLVNERRYGYRACPCRLASGVKETDLDIICPCDYRDPDLGEWGACYCALYVSDEVLAGKRAVAPIPERREQAPKRPAVGPGRSAETGALAYPVWRCRVCGYLCARDEPPDACPICKAKKERFERFM